MKDASNIPFDLHEIRSDEISISKSTIDHMFIAANPGENPRIQCKHLSPLVDFKQA